MPRIARTAGTARSAVDPDVRLLQAIADPTRLGIIRELSGVTEVCACDFTTTSGVSQPTVSHHLRVLREAGVVQAERRGTWIWYSLAPDVGERLAVIARGFVPGGFVPLASLGRGGGDVSRPAPREG
jgi:DNA-binding transcriptional ArsR family regulator